MNKLLILILPLMLVLAACGGAAPKGSTSSGGGASATATGDSAVITLTGGSSQPTYTEYTDVTAPTVGWDPMVCATDNATDTTTIKILKTYTGAGFDDKANWDNTVISLAATATGTFSFTGVATTASIYVNDATTDGGAWVNAEGWTTQCATGTSGSATFVNNGTTVVGTYSVTVKKSNGWGTTNNCTGGTSIFTGSFTATLAGSC